MQSTIDARETLKNVTVTIHVKGLNELRLRLWIATQIIGFGIWFSGMNCKIKEWE